GFLSGVFKFEHSVCSSDAFGREDNFELNALYLASACIVSHFPIGFAIPNSGFVSREKNDFDIWKGRFSVRNVSGREHGLWHAEWANPRFSEPAILEHSSVMKRHYRTPVSD